MGKGGDPVFCQGMGALGGNTFKNHTDMDTNNSTNSELLDFHSFIKKFYPAYEIDGHNLRTIQNIGLWANRDKKFNGIEPGWHIDRGIILSGPVGVGKDELMRKLRKYLSYLRSPYGYGSKVVWHFAKPFTKDGYACFQEDKGNIYYEELGLTDERTGKPTREYVQHFGNTLTLGNEIVTIRYDVFKQEGWQSHFSTNLSEQQLEDIYGNRCLSRLNEMCNFMVLTGSDRRGRVDPVFLKNRNNPAPPPPRETTVDEHMQNKRVLEAEYKQFCELGTVSEVASINYYTLVSYGCQVCTDDEMREFMESVAPEYKETQTLHKKSQNEQEANKKAYVWDKARTFAVKYFYNKMKNAGAKTIFDIVDVNLRLPGSQERVGEKGLNDLL